MRKKYVMLSMLTLSALILTFTACMNSQAATPKPLAIEMEIKWGDYLQRHDIVWEKLPTYFDAGGFLGNGMLGATIYKESPNQLRWEMGRSDVTEHRRDNARLPIGGLVLTTIGEIQSGTMRTDLWNAEVTGTVITDKGTISFRSFIHTHEMVLIIDLETTEGEKSAGFAWDARPCVDYRNRSRYQSDPKHPAAITKTIRGVEVCTQVRASGGEYATAWKETTLDKGRRVILSIADSFPVQTATKQAVATVEKTVKTNPEELLNAHRQWWHEFYPKNFVSIPDAKLESFYWIQWYKLASASRPHLVPVDLLGPWYRETPWARVWWNLNIETLYLPVYTGNRLELGESFINFIDAKRASFYKNAKDIWGFDNCATVPHTTDYEGLRGTGTCAPDKYINPGDFTWALHNYYLHYRYTMDHSMVTDQSKHAFYPLLRDSINLYLKILEKGDDGKLHLPKLHSPEYADDTDNNYNLSLLRWGCQTLISLNKRYDLKDPLVATWEQTLRDLVPYPVDETGLMIGANVSLTKSHRHWSHLQMIHPLHIMRVDQAENKGLLEKSVLHWLTVENSRQVNGWSHAAATSLYATICDGEKAFKHLHKHLTSGFVRKNTMYIEGSPVLECSIVLNRSIQDMLLQSWGDKISVFPAIPSVWSDLVFHDLRTEGAFLVSAKREAGKTKWVRVKSLAGEPCRIQPSIEGDITILQNGKTKKAVPSKDGVIEIALGTGEEIVLFPGNEVPKLIISPIPVAPEECNPWGVKGKK